MKVETKDDAATLRWLQMATDSEETRPVMGGIHVKGDVSESADGFRLHQSPTPEPLKEHDGEIVLVNKGKRLYKKSPRQYVTEIIEGRFPDTEFIFPTSDPTVVIALKRGFLRDVIEMPGDDFLIMKIQTGRAPIIFESEECRAAVMPGKPYKHAGKIEAADRRIRAAWYIQANHPDVWQKALDKS